MITPLRAIATALLTLCSLPFSTAAGEELSFTPDSISLEHRGDDTNGATIRGELTLPAEGLLFQPSPYASDIPEQEKSRADGLRLIDSSSPPQRFATPAQPLVQSADANGCTISATLSHFWPSHRDEAQYNLHIQVGNIPHSGELQLKEQIPFILAQDVIYSEPIPLKPEQIKQVQSDEALMGKLYRIKLGIKAEDALYCTQFFGDHGELLSVKIHQIESDAEGKLEIECECWNAAPTSFRTVKLRDARPITLQLNATLKLPAEQIARAIQQSLGADSPYQSRWSKLYLALTPEVAQYSNSLNLIWDVSGFQGSPPARPMWSIPQKNHYLAHSSELNDGTTQLNQSSMNEKQQYRLSLPHPPSSKQIHFDETLSFKVFEGREISDPLPLNAKQSTTHTINGQEYTATPSSKDKHQGFHITGIRSNDSIVDITFRNAKGDVIAKGFTTVWVGRKGVFFGFKGEQPTAFQIEYQTKPQTLKLPCRFTIPLPEWVDGK